jgi:hypothetical protein
MIINKITSAFNGWEYGLTIAEYKCERSWLTDRLNKDFTGVRYASAYPVFKVKEGELAGEVYEDPSEENLDSDDVEECGWWGWGYDTEEPVELKDKAEAIKFLVNEGKRLELW